MAMQMGASRAFNHHRDFTSMTRNQEAALDRYAEDTALPLPLRLGIRTCLDQGQFTFSIASDTIGMIKDFLKKEEETARVVAGVYLNPSNGTYCQVKEARGSKNLYAQYLNIYDEGLRNQDGTWLRKPSMEWKYVAGLIREIRPEWRITVEQAKAFGDRYSTCIRCGLRLEKPESIERGMGPVCAERI